MQPNFRELFFVNEIAHHILANMARLMVEWNWEVVVAYFREIFRNSLANIEEIQTVI
jgi:hypothetical protein